jgi:hypothetical protein
MNVSYLQRQCAKFTAGAGVPKTVALSGCRGSGGGIRGRGSPSRAGAASVRASFLCAVQRVPTSDRQKDVEDEIRLGRAALVVPQLRGRIRGGTQDERLGSSGRRSKTRRASALALGGRPSRRWTAITRSRGPKGTRPGNCAVCRQRATPVVAAMRQMEDARSGRWDRACMCARGFHRDQTYCFHRSG